MKNTIWSVGHSRRAFSEFLQVLKDSEIEILVDVRTRPYSRFNPHFHRERLNISLKAENILYIFKGKNLGGLEENVDYDKAIDELADMAKQGRRVCVMCSEKDFKKCHRYTMLTPSFEDKGLEVKHIGL